MVHKKKFRIGFYILFLMLSLLLLGTFSTCYALTPSNELNVETASNLLVKIKELSSFSRSSDYNRVSGFVDNVNINDFVNTWNNTINLTNFPTLEQMQITLSQNRIVIAPNNNTYSDNLPNIRYQEYDFGYVYTGAYFINSNNSNTSGYYYFIELNQAGTFNFSFNNLGSGSGIPMDMLNAGNNASLYSQGTAEGVYIPALICFAPSSTYISSSISAGSGWNYNFNIAEIYVEPEPEEPPIIDSTTGVITNNSGDTTGKIDLSGIENGITDVKNQISGDTQKIINSISGETQKVINTITSQPDMDNTIITGDDILENFSFISDPYANFWWDFIDGVELALLGSVRQIPVDWLGYQRAI